MVRKFVSATVSAALCMMTVAPAMAQEYRFAGFDAPRGATATVNLRVPMGRERQSSGGQLRPDPRLWPEPSARPLDGPTVTPRSQPRRLPVRRRTS